MKLTYTSAPSLSTQPAQKKFDSLTVEQYEAVFVYHNQFEDEALAQLVDIHTYCRPHGSSTVDTFVKKFLTDKYAHEVLKGVNPRTNEIEPYAVVITTDHGSRTMISAHVDTVHGYEGRQIIEYDSEMEIIHKPTKHAEQWGDCLGADDGAGIWLLLQMMQAGVPGTYVFHYGEEKGGVGSSGIASEFPDFLRKFDRAVAFDRKGTTDIITHQAGGRCCSDEFAKTLAGELNAVGQRLSMAPDNGGIFTDTANYIEVIPECTNISCGYEGAHSPSEYVDVEYLFRLRDALLDIDWEALPTVRDPKVKDYGDFGWGGSYGVGKRSSMNFPAYEVEGAADEVMQMTFSQLIKWVKNSNPEDVAAIVFELTDCIYAMQDEAMYDRMDANQDNNDGFNDDDGYYTDRLDVGLR